MMRTNKIHTQSSLETHGQSLQIHKKIKSHTWHLFACHIGRSFLYREGSKTVEPEAECVQLKLTTRKRKDQREDCEEENGKKQINEVMAAQ